jgi:hypothetical protein
MPFIILGAVAAYSAIGLAVRQKYFPRESVQTAVIWPAVLLTARGK